MSGTARVSPVRSGNGKTRIALAAAAVPLLAAATITAANATAAHTVSIGNCSTEGDYVSCSVQGDITHPSGITVQVWAVPGQQLSVSWDDRCETGSTAGGRDGSFTVTAGTSHKATRGIPLAAGHRGTCTPDVDVNPAGTGRTTWCWPARTRPPAFPVPGRRWPG